MKPYRAGWLSRIIGILMIVTMFVTMFAPGQLPTVKAEDMAVVSYNRAAAVQWAQNHNYNDGSYRGYTEGRYCTTYVGSALNAGGLNTSTGWSGNQQIIQWMMDNPNAWEDKPLDQLVGGDFVLYSQFSNAPGNWSYIDPQGGWSLWGHTALVTSPGRVAAWNAEYFTVGITAFIGLPYYKGVHIRDTNSANQGDLQLGYNQRQVRNPGGVEHVWRVYFDAGWSPVLIDVKPASGVLTHRLFLTNEGGGMVVDTHSSNEGRGIIALENIATGYYYIHIVPDTGATGEYELAAYSYSIPKIQYDWEPQSSYSNVLRWQAPVGASPQSFSVQWERTDGDLEINWVLKDRETGTILDSGFSSNGEAVAQGFDSNWADFWITSVTGNGSYRISLHQGNPGDTDMPTGQITSPVNGASIGQDTILVQATASDNGGSGVKRVRLYVEYDGVWHYLADDTTAPYEFAWQTECINTQSVKLGIHIEDNAGNYNMVNTPSNPITINFIGGNECTRATNGIYLWQDPGYYIAVVDLNNPDIRVELSHELVNAAAGLFDGKTVKEFLIENSGASQGGHINRYSVAINGTGWEGEGGTGDETPPFHSAGSTLGINGISYWSGGVNDYDDERYGDQPTRSFLAYNSGLAFDSPVDRATVAIDAERDLALATIGSTNPGFVIGYNLDLILDTKNPNGTLIPGFPEFVAKPWVYNTWQVRYGFKTAIGLSADGNRLFMATSGAPSSLETLARHMMDLGASKVLLMDCGSSPQFYAYPEHGGPWIKTARWFGREVINAVVVYNATESAMQTLTIPVAGGQLLLGGDVVIDVPADSFATDVQVSFAPYAYIPDALGGEESLADQTLGDVGILFDLELQYPDGAPANPQAPINIAIPYAAANIPDNIAESELQLYYWNGSVWVPQPSLVDTQDNIVYASIFHPGSWALLAPLAFDVYLPVIQR